MEVHYNLNELANFFRFLLCISVRKISKNNIIVFSSEEKVFHILRPAIALRVLSCLLGVKTLKTAKAVNEDPACLYVGSHRRSNQPNLKNNDEKCKDYCKTDTT